MDDIRILLVEDSELDAELIGVRLRGDGLGGNVTRVQTRQAFLAACQGGQFDVILCDYSLPAFDGPTALAIAREHCPQMPFIFVSGMLGEEIAIDLLKRGANDYVLKQRLERLVPAVRQAVAQRRERTEREAVEAKLRASEHRYRLLVENLDDYAVVMADLDGVITSWNIGAQRVLGFSEAEILGKPLATFFTLRQQLSKRDGRPPYRFTVSGALRLPSGVAKADGCAGKVTVEAKLKAKRVARKTASLNAACQFKTTLTAPRKGSISITAAFTGTASVAALSARTVRVTAG